MAAERSSLSTDDCRLHIRKLMTSLGHSLFNCGNLSEYAASVSFGTATVVYGEDIFHTAYALHVVGDQSDEAHEAVALFYGGGEFLSACLHQCRLWLRCAAA